MADPHFHISFTYKRVVSCGTEFSLSPLHLFNVLSGLNSWSISAPFARLFRKRGRGSNIAPARYRLMKIKITLSGLGESGVWLVGLGAPGLFVLSFVDSAFVVLPAGPDIGVMTLATLYPAWMPLYALTAALGATAGCTLLFLVAQRSGARAVARIRASRRERIERLLARYGIYTVITPAFLPIPSPFKAIVLLAGAFRMSTSKFIISILIARAGRYLAEGWLAIRFGNDASRMFYKHGFLVFCATSIFIILCIVLRKYVARVCRM